MLDGKGGQILGKRSSRSRKGLSTAVGTAFYIIVVLISLSSMWAIGAFQARYQEVTDQMNDWDTERISENLNVRNVSQPVSKISGQKYDINITVDNNGGVTVNIARIYVLDQNNNKLNVSDPMNLSKTQPPARFGFNHSEINTGEVSHVIPVSVTPNLASALSASHECRIILTTDRGRQFSYAYPPPSEGTTTPPPLVYVYGSMKIKYIGSQSRSDSDASGWCHPWVTWDTLKPSKLDDNQVKIKINITNTCGHDVNFTRGSVAYQCSDKQGNRQLFLGGELDSWVLIHNGETKTVIFTINYNNSADGTVPFVYVGLASFSTNKTPDASFLSGAIMLDGLLVPE